MTLSGRRVVVTSATGAGGKLAALLSERDAVVLATPTIEVVAAPDRAPIDDALRRLRANEFDWVLFTSANGVAGLLDDVVTPRHLLSGTRVAAVGAATAARLIDLDVPVDLVPADHTGEALAEALGRGPGTVLLPRAETVPPTVVEILQSNGWSTSEVVTYKTLPASPEGPAAVATAAGDFDAVAFTSASTVRGFARAFGTDVLNDRVVACIGPVTAAAASELGITVDVVAAEHTAEGLVAAMDETMGR